MKRLFCSSSVFILALTISSGSAAPVKSAPQPPIADFGDYACSIEKATGVSASAQTYKIEDAPGEFVFSAFQSRIAPDELRKSPFRRLDEETGREAYEPEPRQVFSASISPDLFAAPAQKLRSRDLRAFQQDGLAIRFESDLSFFAYGPARTGGVVIYTGTCRPSL